MLAQAIAVYFFCSAFCESFRSSISILQRHVVELGFPFVPGRRSSFFFYFCIMTYFSPVFASAFRAGARDTFSPEVPNECTIFA